ncbi:hypothetical protein BCR39DRAFT_107989 [Naematelia encephala]|uniref:Uncharacterized protein n=1 Tax=Naematelia encephala TaxID=71784 RepID=A0A1Y2B729_9TREE|nr:hypothetical protein BCR39DRAFT_107989 [Naematelia encephala]
MLFHPNIGGGTTQEMVVEITMIGFKVDGIVGIGTIIDQDQDRDHHLREDGIETMIEVVVEEDEVGEAVEGVGEAGEEEEMGVGEEGEADMMEVAEEDMKATQDEVGMRHHHHPHLRLYQKGHRRVEERPCHLLQARMSLAVTCHCLVLRLVHLYHRLQSPLADLYHHPGVRHPVRSNTRYIRFECIRPQRSRCMVASCCCVERFVRPRARPDGTGPIPRFGWNDAARPKSEHRRRATPRSKWHGRIR